jgi:hypothetical protein
MDYEALRAGMDAAGLFAAAEAASGGAFVGTFAERLAEIRPLAANAEIAYTKLAGGPIDARARLTDAGGETVATATVQWHLRKST